MKHVLQASDSRSNAATQQAAARRRAARASTARSEATLSTDNRPTRSTSATARSHNRSPTRLLGCVQPLSAHTSELSLSTHTRRPPRLCLHACARLLVRIVFDFLFSALLSHRAPTRCGTQPLPFAAPRPHCRFAYPPPLPRPALLRPVRPPPPTTTHRHSRAHHAARPLASSRRVGGCVLAQRPAAQSQDAPARFSTASGPDARCSSSPSAPCRLSRCTGARGTAGRGRAAGDCCARAPPNSRLRDARRLPSGVAR